ncbi:MAG: hypothetical protein FWC46_07200 [Actinomycetia bacterium]|nr:hypothetical protein [Actinomycetes bacterium]
MPPRNRRRPQGATETFAYQAYQGSGAAPASHTDPDGNVSAYVYNAPNRIAAATDRPAK